MNNAEYDFGQISKLSAESIGEPGQRTFHIIIESKNESCAIIWMEKEQLFNMAVALKRTVSTIEVESPSNSIKHFEDQPPSNIVPNIQVEFKASELEVGYDKDTDLYFVSFYDINEFDIDTPKVNFYTDGDIIDRLAEDSFAICAAGRPLCPLCLVPTKDSSCIWEEWFRKN